MQASSEFVEGKHNIGWVSSDFKSNLSDALVDVRPMPVFQKLPRAMKDAEIESELKPGLCDLGDVLAFLDNAPEECKDGNFNLFYLPTFVVDVHWHTGEWSVDAWHRDGYGWIAGRRVFSPATVHSIPCAHCSLELRISELEEWKKKVEKVINV